MTQNSSNAGATRAPTPGEQLQSQDATGRELERAEASSSERPSDPSGEPDREAEPQRVPEPAGDPLPGQPAPEQQPVTAAGQAW